MAEPPGRTRCARCGSPRLRLPLDPKTGDIVHLGGTTFAECVDCADVARVTVDEAKAILHTLDGSAVGAGITCTRCGYDLRGNTCGSTCPECGATIRMAYPTAAGRADRCYSWVAVPVAIIVVFGWYGFVQKLDADALLLFASTWLIANGVVGVTTRRLQAYSALWSPIRTGAAALAFGVVYLVAGTVLLIAWLL